MLKKQITKITTTLVLLINFTACQNNQTATALGTLERDRVILKTTASEIIVDELVAEGMQVTKGTIILKLSDARQNAILAKAEAQLAIAVAQFEKLRNGARVEDIDVAKSKVNGSHAILIAAQKTYARNKTLKDQGLIPQNTLDTSLANRDSARANYTTATEQLLALTNGTRKEELDQAEATVNSAKAQVDLELIRLSELSIVATRDGYLDSLPYHVGERVNTGSVVAILLIDSNPYARVYVPEPYRVKLKVGDKFTVRVDGIKKNLTGQLRWIDSSASFTPYYALNSGDRARLVYLAEVQLLDAPDLPAGIPVQVLLNGQ